MHRAGRAVRCGDIIKLCCDFTLVLGLVAQGSPGVDPEEGCVLSCRFRTPPASRSEWRGQTFRREGRDLPGGSEGWGDPVTQVWECICPRAPLHVQIPICSRSEPCLGVLGSPHPASSGGGLSSPSGISSSVFFFPPEGGESLHPVPTDTSWPSDFVPKARQSPPADQTIPPFLLLRSPHSIALPGPSPPRVRTPPHCITSPWARPQRSRPPQLLQAAVGAATLPEAALLRLWCESVPLGPGRGGTAMGCSEEADCVGETGNPRDGEGRSRWGRPGGCSCSQDPG